MALAATCPIVPRRAFLNSVRDYLVGFERCRNFPAESCHVYAVLLATGGVVGVYARV